MAFRARFGLGEAARIVVACESGDVYMLDHREDRDTVAPWAMAPHSERVRPLDIASSDAKQPHGGVERMPFMEIIAKWIWKKQRDYRAHNRHIVARKIVRLPAVKSARMAVTADTRYRLFVNGEWVADGPCRAWPLHYQYDVLDVTPYLVPGDNEIRIQGQFFGVGTFHQVPQQAGLLAQLEVDAGGAKPLVFGTDATWQTAEALGWVENTPKISVQMGPVEMFDARLEKPVRWSRAVELFEAEAGPWKDLHPRDSALLTRRPVAFETYCGSSIVESGRRSFSFPLRRIIHSVMPLENHSVCDGAGVATQLVAARACTVEVNAWGDAVRVNGKAPKSGRVRLKKGANCLAAAVQSAFGHTNYQLTIQIDAPDHVALENPLKPGHENPWVVVDFMRDTFTGNDLVHPWHAEPDRDAYCHEYGVRRDDFLRDVVDAVSLKAVMGRHVFCVPSDRMVMADPHVLFMARKPIADGAKHVDAPDALIDDNAACTTVTPSPRGDIELAYDLGDQVVGYWELEAITEESGVVFDVFAVEFIATDGSLQHTHRNHNGMRYIAREGMNRFTSLERRSGRYMYVTIRNATRPVRIRRIGVVESTYPVTFKGDFRCSDPTLDRIWDISARTLQLCMEDTFTDCPLYEQTLWVGDARNESLFALGSCGAEDLVRRCIRLAGQSLDQFPIVGCQVPSAWEVLLPAWSFLWGVSVWDYYAYSGDKKFLREVWPWVRENLRNARTMVDDSGLFSAPYWNMFDWSGIDDRHRTVMHNSLLLLGAIDAAIRCAEVLGRKKDIQWLEAYRTSTIEAANALWDDRREALPDAVLESGGVSPSFSVHNAFLGVLYDALEGDRLEAAAKQTVDPPKSMVPVGSPFAIQYYYEALEKLGRDDKILESIRREYDRMIRLGATTVWEVFRRPEDRDNRFPTRSHCHAWSSAPVYFLNRTVLGIRPTGVGGESVDISPWVDDLEWAEGSTLTAKGLVHVNWRKDGKELHIDSVAPEGVTVRLRRNDSQDGLDVIHNGRRVK